MSRMTYVVGCACALVATGAYAAEIAFTGGKCTFKSQNGFLLIVK